LIRIYNTLTKRKEELVPLREGWVRMYVCGPTVYGLIHVGNARPAIVFDAFRRYLEYRGYRVVMVQNFTDIDDKIINKANEMGVDPQKLADTFIAEYFRDAHDLGIRPANFHPKTTAYIGEIIEMGGAHLAGKTSVPVQTCHADNHGMGTLRAGQSSPCRG